MWEEYVYKWHRKPDGTPTSKPEHRSVWEDANGPIPEGYSVHHLNGNKKDNRLENLTIVTESEHRRLHSGWVRKDDGGWLKPCRKCGEMKDIETCFYKCKGIVPNLCKECTRKWADNRASEKKKERGFGTQEYEDAKRLKRGWKLTDDGKWLKPCAKCGELKAVESCFGVVRKKFLASYCRECCVVHAATMKKQRDMRNQST